MKNYYRPWNVLFSVMLCFVFTASVHAQINGYVLIPSNTTFTPITGGTATSLTAAADEAISTAFPVGFNFDYDGATYTTVQATSNGVLLFGSGKTNSLTNDLATATASQRPGVAALWDDLQCQSGVTYALSGTAPNRILTVQWLNMEWNWLAAGPVISFQVVLHETSNIIDIIYRKESAAVNSASASIGIMGTAATDFISLLNTSTSPTTSTSAPNNAIATAPATGQMYTFVIPTPTPGVPTQDPAAPTCQTGSLLTVPGTPPAGIQWYWQTAATGTSTTTPVAGPLTIYANGTYYVRALNPSTALWSPATSVTVNNFATATPPPAAVAAANPACATTGTTLSVPAPPAGYTYYWQGTVNGGSSNTLDATTPYPVSATGTYYVSAYETATGCWSSTVGTSVTINTYVPAPPTTTANNYNVCTGTSSLMIDATPPPGGPGGTITESFGTDLQSTGSTPVTFNVTVPALPAGAVITSAQLQLTNVNSINNSWRSEIRVATSGMHVLAATQISTLTSGGLIIPDPVINLPGFSTAGGNLTLSLNETFDDGGVSVVDATFGEVILVVTYTQNPVSTLTWYDAATGGNSIGTTSPLETVGTSVLPNANTPGTYNFYAQSISGACVSTTRQHITVNVTPVLATLIPVNVTCNGGINGSFTLGTIQCGTGTFQYAVDGSPFGTIPTNLTAGTHTVVIQDATLATSAPITVVLTEPGVPATLTIVDLNYFSAQVSWTPQGNETSWIVEYGPAGFTLGTGQTQTTSTPSALIQGLTENTAYEFYVTSNCGPVHNYAGPKPFSTNQGFLLYDNDCGPGFIDISGTGTALNLTDEGSAVVTTSFPIVFQGVSSNTVTVSNNGRILFNGVTLNVWSIDLDDEEGNVYHQTLNVGGDNLFIVQWDHRPRFSGVIGQNVTFQMIFNQTTNEIYYIYQDAIFGGSQASSNNAGSGIIGAISPTATTTISTNNATYLTNNSCVHFYYELCPNVTNMTTLIFQDDAILDWNTGPYGEPTWTVIYGFAGFDPTANPSQAIGTLTNLPTSDVSFGSTLTQLTEYDVYIYSECQADNLQSKGYLVNFTTKPFCADVTTLAGTTDVDSLELTWNWTAVSSTYPVTSFNIKYGMSGFDPYSGSAVDYIATGINNSDTIVDPALLSGGVYQVYVQAVCFATNDTSNFVGPITLIMPLTNNSPCGAEMLAVDGTPYVFNNTGATVDTNEPPIAPPNTGAQTTDGWINSTLNRTTWFQFVAPASGNVRINNTAINYNGQAAVYTSSDCADYTTFVLQGANDNEIGGSSLAPNFTLCGLTPGATYYYMHDGFNNTTGNYSTVITPISLEAGTSLPVTDVCSGVTVNLFTTITGNVLGSGTNPYGTWSSSVPAVNASIIGANLISTGLAYQSYTLKYYIEDGCARDSVTSQIHLFPPSNAGEDGTITVCRNAPVDLLSGLNGNADLNGTWRDPSNTPMQNSLIITGNLPGQFNYDYISGNGICPDDTAHVVVSVQTCDYLALPEEAFGGVSVYPNPSEGIVFIDSDAPETFDYVVTDAKGRAVTSVSKLSGVQTKIDLSNVETGIYFIRLTNAAAEKTFRVVIQ